jgi:UDP-2,4-diacetamido-2,4,6-trideoxy-beta-L-altropyranose hydrolase
VVFDGKERQVMRIAFRADASIAIGTGHVMRCLALADVLESKGVEVEFVCRDIEGNLCELIESRGFTVFRLTKQPEHAPLDWHSDADETIAALSTNAAQCLSWIIVDHYQLDGKWEAAIKRCADKIAVIDDLADRPHNCDLLIDQNFYHDMALRYRHLVPPRCRSLIGPEFALLRSEFLQIRNKQELRDGTLRKIFVFFGGSDADNETAKALRGLKQLHLMDTEIDVVIGGTNPHRDMIKKICDALPNTTLHCQVSNMAELMASADLAIGAGGTTTWERCCIGLPALVAILADNQEELTKAVADYGAIVNLGWATQLSADDYQNALLSLTGQQLNRMGQLAAALVDGRGCDKVAEELFQLEAQG